MVVKADARRRIAAARRPGPQPLERKLMGLPFVPIRAVRGGQSGDTVKLFP